MPRLLATLLLLLTLILPAARAAAHGPAVDYGALVLVGAGAWVIGVGAPDYSMTFGPGGPDHGLLWDVSFELQAGRPHGFGVSFAYYPGSGNLVGRGGYRVWLWHPVQDWLHVGAGLGGFVQSHGGGPRAELRIRVGRALSHDVILGNWGLYLAGAYEPDLYQRIHRGELAIGLETPIAFD